MLCYNYIGNSNYVCTVARTNDNLAPKRYSHMAMYTYMYICR